MAIRRRGDRERTGSGVVLPASGTELGSEDVPESASNTLVVVRKPIGELLVESEAITNTQLDAALAKQSEDPEHRRLGELLLAAGVISEQQVADALAAQWNLRSVGLGAVHADPTTVARLPRELADSFDVVPMTSDASGIVSIAVADPTVPDLRVTLEEVYPEGVILLVAPASGLAAIRDSVYETAEGMGEIIRAFEARTTSTVDASDSGIVVDENAPIVQVVTRIIERAVAERASDVHIEPMENRVRVRNRIDGALKEVLSLPASMSAALASRIKIMASLNIVERRRPQDGQIETTVDGRPLDIRVSTAGTVFGESVVLRILDRARALYGLADLGMRGEVEERYRELIKTPYGLVVCAGPTGSGKTTTLYTTLQEVKSDEINVMTVEDPVEYVFPDINQMSINEQAGLTFAGGLRAILRQDPDTILVGEIRDVETARIAIQAALTGHFVLSTVHATDAASALHRFIDMGIEPFLLSSALLATVGQRLVRQVCESCSAPYEPGPDELAFFERSGGVLEGADFRMGAGCGNCSGTGYYGRVGVYEVLRMSDEMRSGLVDNLHAEAIRKIAIAEGMISMSDQAAGLIAEGRTTIAEVMRTVYVV